MPNKRQGVMTVQPKHQALIPTLLHNRYQLQQCLSKKPGRQTYLAIDQVTQSQVVVKVLVFSYDFDWDDFRLFERETKVLKQLSHATIPAYLDSFEIDLPNFKGFALVQTYIPVKSLEEQIQAGRTFTEADLSKLAESLLAILISLHSCKPPIVHRDIKPSNVLLGDRSGHSLGPVYLVDFGSVQNAFPSETGTITVVGTYGYAAPEQYGGKATPLSDLYGLGTTLVYLLTGTHPADLPIRNGRIRFETELQASEPFQTWLRYMIHPDAKQRFQSARSALNALQHPDQLRLQSLQAVRSKPSGSRVILTKTDERLEIFIPPLRIGQKLQVLCTALWLTGFCCSPLLLGFWKIEVGLLVAPFVLWGVLSIWKNTLYKIFEKIKLSIDQREICLTQDWLGLKKKCSSPTQDIVKLERLYYPIYSQNSNTPFSRHSGLNIWAGNQRYSLNDANQEVRRLTDVELDWLAVELSDWLDLPVQTSGEVATQDNQNRSPVGVTNTESNSTENSLGSALLVDPIDPRQLPKINRPENAVCRINKETETIEISAPAAPNNAWGWGCVGSMFYFFICIIILSSIPSLILGLVLIVVIPAFWSPIGAAIKHRAKMRPQTLTRVLLRIDQNNISLWEQSYSEEHCLYSMPRSTIYKLQMVHKSSKKRMHCHIKITAKYPDKTLEESFLVGNQTFWLSRQEAEWLAYELSIWLKLPVKEVEVVEVPSA